MQDLSYLKYTLYCLCIFKARDHGSLGLQYWDQVINSVLSANNYQHTKAFQCDMSTLIYTNSLTNNNKNINRAHILYGIRNGK